MTSQLFDEDEKTALQDALAAGEGRPVTAAELLAFEASFSLDELGVILLELTLDGRLKAAREGTTYRFWARSVAK